MPQTIEFKLPEISEGVETADVAELHVAVGDVIESGQIVLEVETEKAVAEIECPYSGKVTRVHVSEGETIPVGAPLLTIEESATVAAVESPESKVANHESRVQNSESKVASPESRVERLLTVEEAAAESAERTRSAPESRPRIRPEENAAAEAASTKAPAPAGPATRRLARQLGVDLHDVTGHGTGGRITEEDVKAHVRARLSERHFVSPVPGTAAVPPLPDFSEFGPVERESRNKIAKTSASNLSLAWQVVPHVTQHDLADITELEAARKRCVARLGSSAPKITMTAIVMKAVTACLKAFPQFNASLDVGTQELILKRYYHIGCAVDTPNGLLVPVVRDVDQKSVVEIAGEIADLAARARERKLDLKAMQGGTFTISNLGGIGGTAFTPIINYPEVAILGLSRSREELRRDASGQIETRLMLPVSLSYDHRVINGADGARFVAKLCHDLSDAFALFVEC